jgi:hypothetical protein
MPFIINYSCIFHSCTCYVAEWKLGRDGGYVGRLILFRDMVCFIPH